MLSPIADEIMHPDYISDSELLDDWVTRRNEKSLTELIRRHSDMVNTTCRKILGNSIDADDATQETFLSLTIHGSEVTNNIGGWLRVVASHKALAIIRRSNLHTHVPCDTLTAQAVNASHLPDALELCLSELTQIERDIIVQSFLYNESHSDIAASKRMSRFQVQRALSKAIGKVRRTAKRKGVLLSTGSICAALSSGRSLHALDFTGGSPIATSLSLANVTTIAIAMLGALILTVYFAWIKVATFHPNGSSTSNTQQVTLLSHNKSFESQSANHAIIISVSDLADRNALTHIGGAIPGHHNTKLTPLKSLSVVRFSRSTRLTANGMWPYQITPLTDSQDIDICSIAWTNRYSSIGIRRSAQTSPEVSLALCSIDPNHNAVIALEYSNDGAFNLYRSQYYHGLKDGLLIQRDHLDSRSGSSISSSVQLEHSITRDSQISLRLEADSILLGIHFSTMSGNDEQSIVDMFTDTPTILGIQ